jgi:hypothetical protein
VALNDAQQRIRAFASGAEPGVTAARSGEDIGNVLGSEYRAARGAAKGRVADAYTRAFDPEALAEAGVPSTVPVETVQGLPNAMRFAFDDPARGVMVPMAETTPNTMRALGIVNNFAQDGSLPSAFPHLTTAPAGATAMGWQQVDLARKVLKGLQNAAQNTRPMRRACSGSLTRSIRTSARLTRCSIRRGRCTPSVWGSLSRSVRTPRAERTQS